MNNNSNLKLKIDNMTCASCVSKVKRILGELKYVKDVDVNLVTSMAKIEFDSSQRLDFDQKLIQITNAISSHYPSKILSKKQNDSNQKFELKFNGKFKNNKLENSQIIDIENSKQIQSQDFNLKTITQYQSISEISGKSEIKDIVLSQQDDYKEISDIVIDNSDAIMLEIVVKSNQMIPKDLKNQILSSMSDYVKNIEIEHQNLKINYDSTKMKSLDLLKQISKIAKVDVVSENEIDKNINDMINKLSQMKNEQIFLTCTGLPILLFVLISSFSDQVAQILIIKILDFYLFFQIIVGLVTYNQFQYGFVFHKNALTALKKCNLSMDFLLSLSTTCSILYGYYLVGKAQQTEGYIDLENGVHTIHMFEACNSIIWLILFGKQLEKRATVHCSLMLFNNINHSFDKCKLVKDPNVLQLLKDGQKLSSIDQEVRESKLLSPGDYFILNKNEEVPLDSIFKQSTDKEIQVSEHLITGESTPVTKSTEELLQQGSINMSGIILLMVKNDQANSTFMQIKEIVQDAKEIKTSQTKQADQVVAWMISTVLVLGVLTVLMFNLLQNQGVIQHESMLAFSIECLVSMIVVCCPCSIGLTSALVSVQTFARLNSRGIIVRKDTLIEDANNQDSIVFDKTGTLVENTLKVAGFGFEWDVTQIASYKLQEIMLPKEDIKGILQSICRDINHPISIGVVNAYRTETNCQVKKKNIMEGEGICGTFEFKNRIQSFKVGKQEFVNLNEDMAEELNVNKLFNSENAVSYFFQKFDEVVQGQVKLENKIKDEAQTVLDQFRSSKKDIYMQTGDRKACAKKVADDLGITDYQSQMTPSEKKKQLLQLATNKNTMFVGDGVNDAQVIAAAYIGVAIDTKNVLTCSSADLVILGPSLSNLVQFLELSKFSFSVIKQNYFWALVQNLTALPVAGGWFQWLGGFRLSPTQSAMLMMLSCFCIITNSARIMYFEKGNTWVKDMCELGSDGKRNNEVYIQLIETPINTTRDTQNK